jgi:RNA polymerase sigma factor (sigma-70 family)
MVMQMFCPAQAPHSELEVSDQPTDGALLRQVHQCRSADAMMALMRRHGRMVYGVCMRELGDHHHAEDACQETFQLLFRKAGVIARPELLSGWLHGVARRIAARARQRQRRRSHRDLPLTVPDPAAVGHGIDRDIRDLLDQEIQRLPEKYRKPLVLCYLQGRTNEEAAQSLGLPKGTIQSRIARGRDRLRRQLERRGVGLSASALFALLIRTSSAPRRTVGAGISKALAGSKVIWTVAITTVALTALGTLAAISRNSQATDPSPPPQDFTWYKPVTVADSVPKTPVPSPQEQPETLVNPVDTNSKAPATSTSWSWSRNLSVQSQSATGLGFQGQIQANAK